MSGFSFATCDRKRALDFLQRVYPSRTIVDEPGTKAAALLDLVSKDVI